jgi:YidC/Oxa1 family membrane protein insertase
MYACSAAGMLHRFLPRIVRVLASEQRVLDFTRLVSRATLLTTPKLAPRFFSSGQGPMYIEWRSIRTPPQKTLSNMQKRRLQSNTAGDASILRDRESNTERLTTGNGSATDTARSIKDHDVTKPAHAPEEAAIETTSVAPLDQLVSDSALDSSWYDPVIQGLFALHDYTGLPWWATVAAATGLARLLVLPLTLNTFQNSARMQSIKPDLEAIKERMQTALQTGDQNRTRTAQQDMLRLLRENRISPFRSLVNPLVQMPLFIAFFFALRKLARIHPDELKEGGFAWFRDLSAPDPFYGLPALTSVTMLIMIQIGAETGGGQLPKLALNMMRAFALILAPVTAQFPAILFCYWLPSNLFSVIQTYLFRFQRIRRWLGCPPLNRNVGATISTGTLSKVPETDPTESAIRSYLKTKNSKIFANGSEVRLLKNPPRRSSKTS